MIDLKGMHAIVCGASQGIGRACAQRLAERGASVALVARSADSLEDARAQLPREAGQTHHVVAADFSEPESARDAIIGHLASTEPAHILVNNAGGPPGGPLLNADSGTFLTGFRMHVLTSQLLAQSVVPHMREARFGRIVNIISTSVDQPIPGLGVSNTIRGAMNNWARTLAGELGADGITVNNVLPGFTSTDRLRALLENKAKKLGKAYEDVVRDAKATIPAGRFAEPEEIAAAVAFLCSREAAYISGVNLRVDGGRLATQ